MNKQMGMFSAVGTDTIQKRVLGPEKVLNGGFDSPASWTLSDVGMVIQGGKLTITNVGAPNSATNDGVVVGGKKYKVEYTISVFTNGSVKAVIGGVSGVPHGANGTYIEEITAAGTGIALMMVTGPVYLYIDNVSVREISSAEDEE